ncbi:unnamed protein product [Caenorhabditis auriculariae]|uniref:Uncharacterized protein n=1 Tax=Caenorhabditis auriculariae TaxID=2777116 RepID=A0A8S1HAN7_9PELO|nr:unnamed protein product [Caenorhabditis auriculariae]
MRNLKRQNTTFGAITIIGGLIGVTVGTVFAGAWKSGFTIFSKRFQSDRALPYVCAFGSFVGSILLFSILIFFSEMPTVTWSVLFVNMFFLCLNWGLNVDIVMSVIVPWRRNTAFSIYMLISHMFGDATGPYIVGAISDATRKGNTPYDHYRSLITSFYLTAAMLVSLPGGLEPPTFRLTAERAAYCATEAGDGGGGTFHFMTTNVNSVVNVFQNVFTNHGSTLLNGILIATTIGGQSLIRKLTFACPCAYPLNIYHSAVFMVGPSIALLLIGTMVNTTTWKLVHGACFRVSATRHSWKTTFVSWVEVILQACVAPVAWLFVVFLDGGYFRCLRAHEFCLMDTAEMCRNATILKYYQDSHSFDSMSGSGKYCPACICELGGSDGSYLEAQSQIIAWVLVLAAAGVAFLSICCTRMCDKYTLVQRQYVETFKSEEASKFDAIAKEHAAQLADRNARAFFAQKDWSKRDWDWVSGIPEVNNPFFARLKLIATEKTQQTMYTPLQLWNDHKGYRIAPPEVQQVDETVQIAQIKED